MNNAHLLRGVQSTRRLLENLRNLRNRKRASPVKRLAKRFALQKLQGNIGRAILGLAGFESGDDDQLGCRMRPIVAASF